MQSNDFALLRRKAILGTVSVVAWIVGIMFAVLAGVGGGDAYAGLAALGINAGWLTGGIWVLLDATYRCRNVVLWAVLAFVTGPIGVLIYVIGNPPTMPVCYFCGSRLTELGQMCPACGRQSIAGKAATTINEVYKGLADSLAHDSGERARYTAKHMSAALAGAVFLIGFILLAAGPSGLPEIIEVPLVLLWIISLAGYWALVPWWVYLDAKWRRMDAIPWAVLTFITNFVGLATYLVIRYPDPRTCPRCGRSLTPELKRCPYCGVEPEPSCPRCQSPVRADWVYCPACATQLPSIPAAAGTQASEASPSTSVSISGTVTDSVASTPIAGAQVRIDAKTDGKPVTTDPLGRFVLTDLDPRPYVLIASAEGYIEEARPYAPGGTAQMHFSLHPK